MHASRTTVNISAPDKHHPNLRFVLRPRRAQEQTVLVIRSAIVASLGGLTLGFDTAVICGTTTSLQPVYELSLSSLGFTVAIAPNTRAPCRPGPVQYCARHPVTQGAEAGTAKVPIFAKCFRTVILLAFAIATFNQLSGMNTIVCYAPVVMQHADASENASWPTSVAVGFMNLVATMTTLTVIDRFRRQRLPECPRPPTPATDSCRGYRTFGSPCNYQ